MERANLTLQDRLVKELRLRGVDDMEVANAYLPEFVADHNRRFAVAPREAEDAHRPVLHDARRAGADPQRAPRAQAWRVDLYAQLH